MSDDLSPSNAPLTTALHTLKRAGALDQVALDAVADVAGFVFLAKCALLEHRVRDFTAADVVALAALIEARERAARQA
jgi:hypothetical protein